MSDRDDQVDPRGPLEIPVAKGLNEGASHHSPGFDERPVEPATYEADAAATPLTVETPPSAPDQVPRASLSEQMAGQLSKDEDAP